MNQSDKLEKITRIVERAIKDTKRPKLVYEHNKQGKIKGICIKESKPQFQKRLEANYVKAGKALEEIAKLLDIHLQRENKP